NDGEIQINPRFEEFGNNAIFTIKNKLISYMDMNLEDIDIEIDIKNQELETKINSNIDTFKLKEVYKVHRDYIYQLIKDINFRSNKNYINDISDLINSNDNQYKDKILEELILQPYKFKIENNEPLGKLTKDILNELNDFKGGMTENYVNIQLNVKEYTQYYWKAPKGAHEIDFIIMREGKIIPIEVKS
ncbi:DUF4143 domain-containing protein, partial [Fusobacterium mortiferum]